MSWIKKKTGKPFPLLQKQASAFCTQKIEIFAKPSPEIAHGQERMLSWVKQVGLVYPLLTRPQSRLITHHKNGP